MSHALHFEGSRPPPTPREMYGEGMYAGMEEQGHYDHKKNAPPPPKRDPSTRLSSNAQMIGQGNYHEIHVQESPHYHQQAGQHQQQHHNQQQQNVHHQHYQQYSEYNNQQLHNYNLQQQQQQQYIMHQQLPSQQQQHHPHHQSQQQLTQQQQQYYYDQRSCGQKGHGSPVSRSKHSHEAQSPSHVVEKPFSYGQVIAPQLTRVLPGDLSKTTLNGGSQILASQMSPTRPNLRRDESPVMAYGKHEPTFPAQTHRPPPHGPPPPVPQSPGSPSPKQPSSPILPRHSITTTHGNVPPREPTNSPVRKLSQRSMSLPCNGHSGPVLGKSPLIVAAVQGNPVAGGHPAHRTPSPPLPPPPPELLEMSYPNITSQQQLQYHQLQQQQLLQQQQQYSQQQQQHPTQISHGINAQGHPASPQHTGTTNDRSSRAPPPPPLSSIPRRQTEQAYTGATSAVPSLADQINRPRKGSCPVDINGNTQVELNSRARSQSRSESPMRASFDSSADQAGLLQQISKIQLKKTGGRPSFDETSETEPNQNNPPPAQPAVVTPPVSTETSPGSDAVDVIPVNSAVNMFEKKVESVIKEDSKVKRRGDTSKNSNMDISIDNIDLNDVPGYTPVTKSTPIWKRDMIEKKNQEKIEEYIAKKRKEKEDAEKWKNVPAWKRKLMMEKEKEKEKKSEAELQQQAAARIAMKEEEERRKAKIREQQEMEKKMEDEMQELPAWKREIMMKRGGAIKNWTDEREEINEQELEAQRLAEMEAELAMQSESELPPPPPELEPVPETPEAQNHEPAPPPQPVHQPAPVAKVQQSKATVVLKTQAPPPKPEVKKPVPRPSLDEAKIEEEWDSLPLWKREIMMKRGGAPSNWGDEREEKNEDGVEQ